MYLPVREVFVEARSPGRQGKRKRKGEVRGWRDVEPPSKRPSLCLLIDLLSHPCFSS